MKTSKMEYKMYNLKRKKIAPGNLMLNPRFVMEEMKRSKSGLTHNGIEGVVFSGQDPTQIDL